MPVEQKTHPREPRAVSAADVRRLLASDPPAAEARAREILTTMPQNVDALLVLGAALRRQGKNVEAKTIFEPIVATQPDFAFALFELGQTLALLGNHKDARDALARAVDLSPTFVGAWCALGDELAHSKADPLAHAPDDDIANSMRAADAAIAKRDFADAEAVLARLVEHSPGSQIVQFRYAIVLLARGKAHLALPVIEELIHRDNTTSFYRELRASALCEVGDFHRAIAQYEEFLDDDRPRPGAWVSYGRALRAIGRQEACAAAFRKAIEILPAFAEGYRTLATIKANPLPPESIDQITGLLARPGLLTATRAQLHFALAKALEDSRRYEESFKNYTRSQELQGTGIIGTGRKFREFVQQMKAVFTREYFSARSGKGCEDNGPIFVVGMPRSGSTLVQEILAAHPSIERTGELQDLTAAIDGHRNKSEPDLSLLQRFARLDAERLKLIGADYLARTRPRRKQQLPLFVDKLPGNFIYSGLIHLILPNAKIVDVRRHPLDCCVSCFTNYFPQGPVWAHSLDDLGHYYAGYVELMAHFDEFLPGRIHRVIYEQLIEDPEREMHRLLTYLGLPYNEQCLRYYDTEQAILTTSVEQARRPINRSGIGASRKFEPWLGPLAASLGQVLDAYPAAPQFHKNPQATFNTRIV